MRFRIYLTLNWHRIEVKFHVISMYFSLIFFLGMREGFQRPGGIPWEGFSSGLPKLANLSKLCLIISFYFPEQCIG